MEYKRNDWRKTNLEFIAPEDGDLMTREQFIRYLKKTEVSGDFTKEVGYTLFYYNSAKHDHLSLSLSISITEYLSVLCRLSPEIHH